MTGPRRCDVPDHDRDGARCYTCVPDVRDLPPNDPALRAYQRDRDAAIDRAARLGRLLRESLRYVNLGDANTTADMAREIGGWESAVDAVLGIGTILRIAAAAGSRVSVISEARVALLRRMAAEWGERAAANPTSASVDADVAALALTETLDALVRALDAEDSAYANFLFVARERDRLLVRAGDAISWSRCAQALSDLLRSAPATHHEPGCALHDEGAGFADACTCSLDAWRVARDAALLPKGG